MRILLVENDSEWLGSIPRSLPDYQVDTAQTYEAALDHLRSGKTYDLAIVDLNLFDSPDSNPGDLLGGKVLERLRSDHPSTRRIALTAWPPTAVREQVFDKYDVDELLIKRNLTLGGLREVVEVILARTSAHLPAQVRARRSELWADFRTWRDDQAHALEQRKRVLLAQRRMSARMQAEETDIDEAIAALESRQASLSSDCAAMETRLADIDCAQDATEASGEIERLKAKFAAIPDL